MFCIKCGNKVEAGSSFCSRCGAPQNAVLTPDERNGHYAQNLQPSIPPQYNAQNPQPNMPPQYTAQNPQPNIPPQYTAQNPPPNMPPQYNTQNPQPNMPPQYTAQNPRPNMPPQYNAQAQAAYSGPYRPHAGYVSFGQAIGLFWKNYTNFSGRASRSEYWWVFLFNSMVGIVIGMIGTYNYDLQLAISSIASLAVFLPGMSLYTRRLHDVGKSGWFICIIFVPFAGVVILLINLCKGSEGDNRYGPGPGHTWR